MLHGTQDKNIDVTGKRSCQEKDLTASFYTSIIASVGCG